MPLPLHRHEDPVERLLADDAAADHAQAKTRGERVRDLADAIAVELHGRGMLHASRRDTRAAIFHILADDLYGNAAIDIPNLWEDR